MEQNEQNKKLCSEWSKKVNFVPYEKYKKRVKTGRINRIWFYLFHSFLPIKERNKEGEKKKNKR